jgi:uncharacterized phiE125 gp8 family phage protein
VALVQLVGAATEPVTLADAKNHLRIDSDITQDDALLAVLIGAARRYAESWTNRSFITQTWRLTLDCFPALSAREMAGIQLERGNVLSVQSVNYRDLTRTNQVMPSTDYLVDIATNPGRITPQFGKIWPIPVPEIASVWVDFTAGYGPSATDVPEGIRQWILLRLSTLYERRAEAEIVAKGRLEPMPFVDSLLDPYRIVTL